jgi:hypothetical protein
LALARTLEAPLSEFFETTGSLPSGEPVQVRTFAGAVVMSTNNGVVLRVGNEEFQVTIVQSR